MLQSIYFLATSSFVVIVTQPHLSLVYIICIIMVAIYILVVLGLHLITCGSNDIQTELSHRILLIIGSFSLLHVCIGRYY